LAGLTLAKAVPGYLFAEDKAPCLVSGFVPVVVASSIRPLCEGGGFVLDPSLTNAQITTQSSLFKFYVHDNALAVASAVWWEPVVVALGTAVARYVPDDPVTTELMWVFTTRPLSSGTRDVSNTTGGTRAFAFPRSSFSISYNVTTGLANTLPYMVVYADLGVVVFAASLKALPQATDLLREVESPGSLRNVPYIAPFACVDLLNATVTYLWEEDNTVLTMTWSSASRWSVPRLEFQVVYDRQLGTVVVVYRLMPLVWGLRPWLSGTAMSAGFHGPRKVLQTHVVALPSLPRQGEILNYGVAQTTDDLDFVRSVGGSVGNGHGNNGMGGSLFPKFGRENEQDVENVYPPLVLASTVAVIAKDGDGSSRLFFASERVQAEWARGGACVRAVQKMPVDTDEEWFLTNEMAVLDNTIPLSVLLMEMAPYASRRSPVAVVVFTSVVRLSLRQALPRPGDLWKQFVAVGISSVVKVLPDDVTVSVRSENVYADMYSAVAFFVPVDWSMPVSSIVSATFAFRPGGDSSSSDQVQDGALFILQLAWTAFGQVSTQFPAGSRTCATIVFAGSAKGWFIRLSNGYRGVEESGELVGLEDYVPYVLGSDFTLLAGNATYGAPAVTTVVVGLPPWPGTSVPAPVYRLLRSSEVTVICVQTQHFENVFEPLSGVHAVI
jgi:hypothetical protein